MKEKAGGIMQTMRLWLRQILWPKDTLLRMTDRRFHGLWLGDAPTLLTLNELREGQILFGVGAPSNVIAKFQQFLRKLISYASSSPIVHCGVLIRHNGKLEVFESVFDDGVVSTPVSDFVSRYDYVSVYHDPALNQHRMNLGKAFADELLKQPPKYAPLAATWAPIKEYFHQRRHWSFPRNLSVITAEYPNHRPKRFFCSQLVLAFFRATNIPGFEKHYFRPDAWTPGLLAEDNIFRFVGFLASSYATIQAQDPVIAGAAHRLKRWEEARLSGDLDALNTFSCLSDQIMFRHAVAVPKRPSHRRPMVRPQRRRQAWQ
ncbi:MAG TPA: hypothetical protein VJ577_16860 [Burkholderiaceae bacterium]|nr:hypothetical protein [Burkholderiaceae bacterium]